MDDEARVAAIRERAEAATSGPWERRLYDGVRDSKSRLVKVVSGDEYDFERVTSLGDYITEENAEFIAAAREDIPWLLDRLRAAEARAAEAEAVIAEAPHEDMCALGFVPASTGVPLPCMCWKAEAPAAVLARVKAEAWDEGVKATLNEMAMVPADFDELVKNPYRKQVK